MSLEETKSHDRASNQSDRDATGTKSKASSAGVESSAARSTPSGDSRNGKLKRKSVRFNDIQIRYYERTVGDNPSCSSGPPIG